MSHRTEAGTLKAVLDREAVLAYQAAYLARKFSMTPADARAFVDRFGLDRSVLNQAVQQQLQCPKTS
jgi:hypothetical protein